MERRRRTCVTGFPDRVGEVMDSLKDVGFSNLRLLWLNNVWRVGGGWSLWRLLGMKSTSETAISIVELVQIAFQMSLIFKLDWEDN